jgi:serine/threonine protein kinase
VPNITPLHAEDPDRVGRHRLTGRISGMPGTGPFYLATDADGTEVSLRLLRGSWTRDAAARDRFAAEAAAARRVPPFCAARILDAGVEDGFAYLVSEYVAGKSLLETVSDDGRLRGLDLEGLAIGSATGLASVHQAGLVHGGFGPEHVIMSADGPRIIEFGITPPYGAATPSADMLAWAQTMVFASMGRPPATLADLDVLPGLLRQTVGDCLAADPALRPAARSVVLDLLDDIEPPAGALAEGSRRAAAATYASRAAQPDSGSQQARGGRSGPGGRAVRQSGQHQASDGQRQRERARPAGYDRSAAGRRRTSGQASGPRSGRSGVLPIAAAAVVIVAIAVVIVLVLHNAGGPASSSQGGDSATAPPTSSTSPVSSTVSAAPSPASVPGTFAGSWSGKARQTNPSDVYKIRLNLPAGSSNGRIVYSSASFSCTGDLNLQSASRAALRLAQGIVNGQQRCADGVVTLSIGADGALKFSFRGKTGPAASGTLTKS